ncbi:unnamed protein product [Didymodactylos carnosus]|uniref:Uncharacterized protein n=1 Tax=Didymodactylos carnosus TaxID=1234261 RepID=A0A814RYB3_9BILA|nr:unnamed protein product [Didymodactylos carnosus]CAF1283666.1 unnamed protein product [Didymodactylos carnosus]CAF3904314.1 unnamed protein product [Didymodactylos carnosus]CAF4088597.1 unnamed protein product [Didymodactylos carnosus]
MRRVLEKLSVLNLTGIKLVYARDFVSGSNDEELELLSLLYADDVAAADNPPDIELFIRTFDEVSQEFGLTMSIKKTCILPVRQLKEDA